MAFGIEHGPRFLQVMKRYCIDYVNAGDQSVTRDLMVEDYLLRMGRHEVRGRDSAYFDATARQLTQFPHLMLTVHEIATSGERLMMRFSEHGRRASDGALCAWGGIALYRWDGQVLVQCNVEQDYWSRRRQIASGIPDTVDHPAIAPWDVTPLPAEPAAETAVRAWLEAGGLDTTTQVLADEEWLTQVKAPVLEQRNIAILDLFSAGKTVGFHVRQHGAIRAKIGALAPGDPAALYAAGIVHVEGGAVVRGRIIRNRLDLERESA